MKNLLLSVIAMASLNAQGFTKVDTIQYHDSKTTNARLNAEATRELDPRCKSEKYLCKDVESKDHSDKAHYEVYSFSGSSSGIKFLFDQHFRYDPTAQAYQMCISTRESSDTCARENIFCTACTREAHTDHSGYKVYLITDNDLLGLADY
ncbi:hypothetical protein [Pseudobacteriovorax antillogorgiicola]|uniref:Uncharacterized protein n=1 Tax=Pseudobacteriovorax antillogorgiicola TaxID=1513793 RepID=A0A1Y6BQW0_9BACT|nr:hypothetical protein [Pseudobacteriovorax antillogorgiicola]TCS53186.1 hypothetical protein EDD56_108237 [Pseudobacteriovorax antillogorgiicola]SMF24495.1 hypothetical protein SAMN06296036_1089 [Pseudobacteriovorax antillogorgiicola]